MTNAPAKPITEPNVTEKVDTAAKAGTTDPKLEVVTLDQLAREKKMPPRDARMLLRLAAKQIRQYPNLGKDHVARQPWSWTPGSKALEEARKALSTPPND